MGPMQEERFALRNSRVVTSSQPQQAPHCILHITWCTANHEMTLWPAMGQPTRGAKTNTTLVFLRPHSRGMSLPSASLSGGLGLCVTKKGKREAMVRGRIGALRDPAVVDQWSVFVRLAHS